MAAVPAAMVVNVILFIFIVLVFVCLVLFICLFLSVLFRFPQRQHFPGFTAVAADEYYNSTIVKFFPSLFLTSPVRIASILLFVAAS